MKAARYELLNVDKKGRIHIPKDVREELGIEVQVVAEREKDALLIKPMKKIKDPLAFLASINIKTKETPVQMKRRAEKYFSRAK